MPSSGGITVPSLASFSRSVRSRGTPVESSIENLISVVETFKFADVSKLIERVQLVGQRLISAQPRELAIGNIVRRVLGVIRMETEEDREGETSGYSDAGTDSRPQTPKEQESRTTSSPTLSPRNPTSSPLRHGQSEKPGVDEGGLRRPPLITSHASYAATTSASTVTSMLSIFQYPQSSAASPTATPGSQSPGGPSSLSGQALANSSAAKDLKAEVVEGIQEILEELNQADDQIAGYALEHIHSNEIILTHSSSGTVQKFLLKAAAKRRFTVVHAEAYPNDSDATHATISGEARGESSDDLGTETFQKTLTAAGIIVILIPDSAVFALMSRVNKVILSTHVVLANGGLVAAAGAKAIAKAAKLHCTPVVVLSGVYKLSPVYPFDLDSLMENGDPSKVVSFDDAELVDKVGIENPLYDYVPVDLIDLYITNL
ncbi:translation initiation factor eIF-2B subunit beta, partial [Lecanoromycetidae sp. Uapishka_2]